MKETRVQIPVRVSKKKHKQYKLACLLTGKRMNEPLLKAIDKMIKIGEKYA